MAESRVRELKNEFKIFDVSQSDFIDPDAKNEIWQSFFEDQKEYFSICPKSFPKVDDCFGTIYIVDNINFARQGISLDEVIKNATEELDIEYLTSNQCLESEHEANKPKYISFLIFNKCGFSEQSLLKNDLSSFILYFSDCKFSNCLNIHSSEILNMQGVSSATFKNCYWGANDKSELINFQSVSGLNAKKPIYFNIINPFIRDDRFPGYPTTTPSLNLNKAKNIHLNICFTGDYEKLRNNLDYFIRSFRNCLDIRNVDQGNNYSNNISIFNNKSLFIDIKCFNLCGDIQIVDSKDIQLCIEGGLRKLESFKSGYRSIRLNNCNFKTMPYFSGDCIIQQKVHIDHETLKNIGDIGEELEYSRLAEFLNRSKAYIEAQKLHKHYLQAKAKNETQLKWLVPIYNLINGCGTSLLRPIIGVLFCWFFVYIIFLCSNFNLVLMFQGSEVTIYKNFAVLYSIKQAFLVTVPLLATIEKPDISLLSTGWQLVIYALMIISYLLVFLMVLQIRKLLKLKE